MPYDLRRRLLLLDTIPRVLVTRLKQRLFRNEMTTEQLYGFVLDRLRQVTDRVGARLVILNIPPAASERAIDEGSWNVVRDCGCATLVDGHRALARRGPSGRSSSTPIRQAHAAYAAGLFEALSPRP